MAGQDLNPYAPPQSPGRTASSQQRPRSVGATWFLAAAVAASLVGPVVASGLVIDLLLGIENLTRPYWIRDGVVLSLVLNGLLMAPLVNRRVRSIATLYVPCTAVVVAATAFAGYLFFMVAMMA